MNKEDHLIFSFYRSIDMYKTHECTVKYFCQDS